MPILIIGWSIYDKLPEKEQKDFVLVERIALIIFMSAMSMKMRIGIRIMSKVIDALRIKRNYWSSSVMK
tara:strand:- start:891 stop:1097 length:207 start_codon:yes stop_codon:yes gene_type:complete